MGEGAGRTGMERHHIDLAPMKVAGSGGGFGASERFPGPDGRDWAKWLVDNVTEYNGITDPELKILVAKLARLPDSMVDGTILRNSFQKIEELFDDGKITSAEESLWGTRISSRAEDVADRNRYLEATARAKAEGFVGPERALEEFRDGEEYLKPTTVISPGNEPRFWVILTEDEKKEVYVRSTLMIIGYKKQMAPGTDKLYMDEMRELAVDLNKIAHQRIFKKPGVLPTVGIYSTVIGDPKFLSYKSENDLSLKTVFGTVLEDDPKLKKKFYTDAGRKTLIKALKKDYGNDIFTRDIEIGSDNKVFEVRTYKGLLDIEKDVREGSADSFYPHDGPEKPKGWGTPIEEASFRKLKKAIRFWLVTKGRDLLLSDEEKKNRERFFGNEPGQFSTPEERLNYKKARFKELCARARDAEQIAWNYTYATSLLESFDSREYRPEKTVRHAPAFYWCLFQWIPMHPQERFESKIKRSVFPEVKIKAAKGSTAKKVEVKDDKFQKKVGEVNVGEKKETKDTKHLYGKDWAKIEYAPSKEGWVPEENYDKKSSLEAKEDWASAGTWGVYNLMHGGFRDASGHFKMPDNLKFLPDTLIRSPLFTSRFKERNEASLFDIYNSIGNDVLHRTDFAAKDDLYNRIDWAGMTDSPFVPFNFDEMRWADVVTNVFKKGGEQLSKVSGKDFSEAAYNLELTKRQRDLLLFCYFGIRPKAPDIRPSADFIYFNGFKNVFLKYNPNFYLGAK